VTKLATENLCYLILHEITAPHNITQDFYRLWGPDSGPDMGYQKVCKGQALKRSVIERSTVTPKTRDFTYISDAVAGKPRPAQSDVKGESFQYWAEASRISVH